MSSILDHCAELEAEQNRLRKAYGDRVESRFGMTDEERKARKLERERERYANDPEFRKRKNLRHREYCKENREKLNETLRLKRHLNIEKEREKNKTRYRKKMAQDPEYNKKHYEKYRDYYRASSKRRYWKNKEAICVKAHLREIRKCNPQAGTDMEIYRKHAAEVLSAISLELADHA